MSYRPFNNELRNSLYNNDPYIVAHLVKFERPSLSDSYSGVSSEAPLDYSYLTDSPIDIEFDDGTFNRREQYQAQAHELDNSLASPVSNGPQTYYANKLLNVGTINEGIEAKASTLSLKLDANPLGTVVHSNCTFNADQNTIVTDVDFSEEGFVEGDKILFAGGGTNSGLSVIINRFTAGGTTLKVTVSGGSWTTQNSASLYTITHISEELNTLILGNGNISYTNYINREVTVYRVHIDPTTNEIIGGRPGFTGAGSTYVSGGAMLLFRGIISNASLNEDPKKGAVMQWSLSSHWGDFVRVQNRVTQDSDHRALNTIGIPDTNMLLRQEYAGDLGFAHSELALNLIATYNKTETRTKLKKKKKWGGLSKKYTQTEYQVEVPTDVDLKLNLEAKALPVVYGVQKIDSIPFFFDNLKTTPSRIYAGYALCEGSIGGVLDIIIDDKTTICVDEKDSQARSVQTEEQSVDVVCQGRQDRGQTLIGTPSSQGVGIYTHTVLETRPGVGRGARAFFTSSKNFNAEPIQGHHYYTQTTRTMDAGGVGFKGIQHEEAFKFTTPIDCTLIFHKGTPYQRANGLLVEKADKKLFKVQNDYFEGNPGAYWTPNHRVLDTAYCIGEFQIGEGETEMPSLDFIVRGRDVECYNYDGSFGHQASYSSESPGSFNAGDTVFITGTGITEYSTTIIDKWSFIDGSGVTQHRYRWATEPTPTGHDVKMSTQSGSGGTEWHMLVGGSTLKTGTISVKLEASFAGTQSAGKLALGTVPAGWNTAMAAQNTFELAASQTDTRRAGMFGLRKNSGTKTKWVGRSSLGFGGYDATNKKITDVAYLPADVTPDVAEMDVDRLVLRNAIKLPSGGTPALQNDTTGSIYIGSTISLYRFDSVTNIPYKQEREIVAWNVSGNDVIAIVGEPWDPDYEPQNGDLFSIETPKDTRVSINPAMQLLDYMKSKRYGKGLKDSDIDLETFKSAAVGCDTRSDVTVIVLTPTFLPQVGAVYRRIHTGVEHFRGTVSRVVNVSSSYTEITFTDVIGKLAQKWNDYTVFAQGAPIWEISPLGVTRLKLKTGSAGVVSSFGGSATGNDKTSLVLSKESGTGQSNLTVDCTPTQTSGDGNPVVKAVDAAGGFSASGYSLYDSDNVKYWKYLGWDSRAQRNVTRHQLNQTIDTSNTVFENINTMLKQFNGILRYSNGSYQLKIKSKAGALSTYEKVLEEDIIGAIKLTDKGSKKTYNSISASILDPQNNFESRSVSFFNSDYMRQDNGVPKKGSFSTPGITNYFNARFNIKQFLDESRNGLEIQFTTRPSGLLLLAGEVIALTYGRFGWDEKLWRITNLNFLANGQVSVTAEEHSDNSFVVEASEDAEGVTSKISGPGVTVDGISKSPHSLVTQGGGGGIELLWRHGVDYTPASHDVQVFSSTKNFRTVTTTANGSGTESTTLVVDNTGGDTFAKIAVGTVIADGVSVNTVTNNDAYEIAVYEISVLGNTDWAALDGSSETEFSVGDLIVPGSTGTFSGTGQMRVIGQTIKVTAVDATSNTVTLNSPFSWADGDSITFRAALLAGRLDTDRYVDPVIDDELTTTRYYWLRYSIKKATSNIAGQVNRTIFSAYHPNTVAGVSGVAVAANVLRDVTLTTNNGSHFTYETDGTGIESPGYATTTTITAAGVNVLGTANYKFEVVNNVGAVISTQAFSTSNSLTYTPPTAYTAMPQFVRVTFRDTYNNTNYEAVKELQMTASRITSDGEQSTVPGPDGEVARSVSLKLSDSIIEYDQSGLNPSPTSITVSASVFNTTGTVYYEFLKNGTTVGSIGTSNSLTYTVPTDKSNMPESWQVKIREGSASGTVVATDSETLNGVKAGKEARSVDLTSSTNVIRYDTEGLNPTPSSITITATAHDTVGTVYYRFKKDGVQKQLSTSSTYTYNVPTNITNMPDELEVEIRESNVGDNTSDPLAIDKETISAIQDGSDALTIVYSNESHGVTVDTSGTPTWTGSGGILQVFDGPTALTLHDNDDLNSFPSGLGRYNVKITKVGGTTLTKPSVTGEGTTTATLSDFGGSSITAPTQYKIKAKVRDLENRTIDLIKYISLVPSKDGDGALSFFYTNQAHIVPVDLSDVATWTGSGGVFNVYDGLTELTLDSNTQSSSSFPSTAGKFILQIFKVSGNDLTEGAITGAGTGDATYAGFTGTITGVTQWKARARIKRLNGDNVTREVLINLNPVFQQAGGPAISASNLSMVMRGESDGSVQAVQQFISHIQVVTNQATLTYDSTPTSGENTWHWGSFIEQTNNTMFAVVVAPSTGSLSLHTSSYFYDTDASNTAGGRTPVEIVEFDAQIENSDNEVIGVLRYSIRKEKSIRPIGNLELVIDATAATVDLEDGSGTVIGEPRIDYQFTTITTNSSSFATGNARDWCGGSSVDIAANPDRGFIGHVEIAATTATAAIKIASSMVDAEDGVKILRTGDRFRIRVRKTGTNDTFMAAERIYIGPNITSTDAANLAVDGKDHHSWSTVVAEKVFGSMIVDGTLSANAIDANDIRTTHLNVRSTMELGTIGTSDSSSTRAKIFSAGRTTFNGGTEGFFLGYEGSGNQQNKVKFALGNNDTFVKWDGTTLSIAGTIAMTAASTIDGTTASTVKSGAASGATANQDSTSTILGGNHTGNVGGTANSVVANAHTTAGTSSGASKAFFNNHGMVVTSGGVTRVKIGDLSNL